MTSPSYCSYFEHRRFETINKIYISASVQISRNWIKNSTVNKLAVWIRLEVLKSSETHFMLINEQKIY